MGRIESSSKIIMRITVILAVILVIGSLSIAPTAEGDGGPLALRISSYPKRVFNGETVQIDVEILNVGDEAISGVELFGDNIEDYSIGTVSPDESVTLTVDVEPWDYVIGTNKIDIKADSDNGDSKTRNIRFRVLQENLPVEVFLSDINSPIYEGETLELSLVVYGATDSEANDLRVRAKSENVIPTGYGVGDTMKTEPVEEPQPQDLQQVIGGGSTEGEGNQNQEDKIILGRELYFKADNLTADRNSLTFEVVYNLENRSVTQSFQVDFEVRENPDLRLIQTEPLEIKEGGLETIPLEIVNEMTTKAEAVMVIPPENYEMYPSTRYIGSMSEDDYLPLDFEIYDDNLKDGENLPFYVRYRLGNEFYKSQPLTVKVNLKEEKNEKLPYLAAIAIVSVIIVAAIYYWRPEVSPWNS